MESQIERLEQLVPGITARYPIGYKERRKRRDRLSSLYGSEDGSLVHEKCKKLEERLNGAVAPDVVVGKVMTGELSGAVPLLQYRYFSLPMAYADAAWFYWQLNPSLVGVELRGDVLDTDLRRSHEILASKVELPTCLRDFDFPEEVRKIHETLCPSGESIRIEPYKIIFYGAGDFFVPHRDSMDYDANMFGTISLGLPIAPKREGRDYQADEAEAQARGLPGPSEEVRNTKKRVGEAGQLVLYVGYRESDATQRSMAYEYEESKPNMLTHVVDMEAIIGAGDGGDGGVSVTMSYGAWTGDVLHEVRRIESGYRAVLTYKLFKQGDRSSYIPAELRTSVEQEVSAIVSGLSALVPAPPGAHLGFSLRHGYPPAGLRPSCLKGIDAMVHSIVSALYETALFTGYEVRDQEFFEMHALPEKLYGRAVFVTKEVPREDFGDEDARDNMARKYPVVEHTVWISLGYGTLQGGGFCFGNADCGTDWWYRQAFLLIGQPKQP